LLLLLLLLFFFFFFFFWLLLLFLKRQQQRGAVFAEKQRQQIDRATNESSLALKPAQRGVLRFSISISVSLSVCCWPLGPIAAFCADRQATVVH